RRERFSVENARGHGGAQSSIAGVFWLSLPAPCSTSIRNTKAYVRRAAISCRQRSRCARDAGVARRSRGSARARGPGASALPARAADRQGASLGCLHPVLGQRSEEHTSEL